MFLTLKLFVYHDFEMNWQKMGEKKLKIIIKCLDSFYPQRCCFLGFFYIYMKKHSCTRQDCRLLLFTRHDVHEDCGYFVEEQYDGMVGDGQ